MHSLILHKHRKHKSIQQHCMCAFVFFYCIVCYVRAVKVVKMFSSLAVSCTGSATADTLHTVVHFHLIFLIIT